MTVYVDAVDVLCDRISHTDNTIPSHVIRNSNSCHKPIHSAFSQFQSIVVISEDTFSLIPVTKHWDQLTMWELMGCGMVELAPQSMYSQVSRDSCSMWDRYEIFKVICRVRKMLWTFKGVLQKAVMPGSVRLMCVSSLYDLWDWEVTRDVFFMEVVPTIVF